MKKCIYKLKYLEIDGPMGSEIIPCDVADMATLPEIDREIETPEEIAMYCENDKVYSIERKDGYVGRMSAPGYMDCTPYVAGATAEDVSVQLDKLYGDDDE